MAMYDDGYFSFAGTDLSSFVKSLDVAEAVETNDDTTMGADTRSAEAGLQTRTVSVLLKDVAGSAAPRQTLAGTLGTEVAIITAPNGSSASVENPLTTQNMLVQSIDPQFGDVGSERQIRVQLVAAGSATVATS